MSKTIRAAVYETHGNPPDVLRVIEQPWPTPAAGEVVVAMRAAPLNPADINLIEGKYPVRATLTRDTRNGGNRRGCRTRE